MRKLLSLRLLVFWVSMVVGGLLLGADNASKPLPLLDPGVNWDAVGALTVIAVGFVSLTWFIVSMAILSATRESEARMIALLNDPEGGYVQIRMCKIIHESDPADDNHSAGGKPMGTAKTKHKV